MTFEATLGFDPDALRERYAQERDKRLRPEANEQYVRVAGDYSYLEADPFVEKKIERAPLQDEVDVVLIGAGFGGLLTGARLRQLGVQDIRIIDKGGDVGGTWYFNRYPGVACDIESYVYLPMLEEVGYIPKEKYAKGGEIYAHCKAIAKKYDLYRNICLQTTVEGLRWDDVLQRWIITTDRGDEMKARFVSLANGFLQKPKLPGIPGIDNYQGKMFHTCRWDYSYTGGKYSDTELDWSMTGLQDKRVGIIGTGATAVQLVPHLGKWSKHLFVFQRTPSSIGVRANTPTDPAWVTTLQPGWHQARMDNFQTLTAGGYAPEDLVQDGWTQITATLVNMISNAANPDFSPEGLQKSLELADFVNMEEIRKRVDEIVSDRKTADALKPWYRQFCKRPCFHDEYLQTFNLPNVTLVDTLGQGVERISEKGVIVDGREYELDCLIFATGFEVGTDYARRAGFDPAGRNGLTLTQKWANGARTLHGIHIHGFPNLYMMGITQSGFTVNFMHMIDQEARHIAYVIDKALRDRIDVLEVTATAEAEWVQTVFDRGDKTIEFAMNCTPGYYNGEGKLSPTTRQDGFFFGDTPMQFIEILEQWRAGGDMPGMDKQ